MHLKQNTLHSNNKGFCKVEIETRNNIKNKDALSKSNDQNKYTL